MTIQYLTIRADHRYRVEQRRSGKAAVNLVESDNNRRAVFEGSFLQRIEVVSAEIDGVLTQLGVKFTSKRHILAGL